MYCKILEGVLVGSDEEQEWLLPWWWENYSRHNNHPVAFADFGMSLSMREWCKKRGELFSIEELTLSIAKREDYDSDWIARWEANYGSFIWKARRAWFKKPYAMLQSPFEYTLWLDLDCEILGSIAPLFAECTSPSGVGVVPEPASVEVYPHYKGTLTPGQISYNTGVLIFRKGAPLIQKWAEWSVQMNRDFVGDQDLFSHLIATYHFQVNELSPLYNWIPTQGLHLEALIVHWISDGGKEYIRKIGGIRKEIEAFKQLLDSEEKDNIQHFLHINRIYTRPL